MLNERRQAASVMKLLIGFGLFVVGALAVWIGAAWIANRRVSRERGSGYE